ncbi:TonB-dependent siderophore receptor [Sphingosinicella sp. CPCC 101087]|uniref:TonB-dependent receptor n=1 Tax=Sphingosinicella sp. CPCC 101087 TaxID=2497754 RepID=UPI00101BDC4F|nr:TonB-dependent receptor [Sphingosinicella sp. CPCC 101087]
MGDITAVHRGSRRSRRGLFPPSHVFGATVLRLCLALPSVVPAVAYAQAVETEPDGDTIIVTGTAARQLLLDARTETGSRLGLTVRETPAIVDILSERQIREFGARTNVEALNRAPGVTSSLPATSPGVPAMRGFTGGSVGLLYDGVRVATPGIFSRASDSWLYDRIEILKGPASVLYGEGALAGAINLVPKKPRIGETNVSALASYGSFDTLRLAGDLNLPIGDRVAVRGVGAYGRTSGFVEDTDADFLGASLGVEFRPTELLTVDLAIDYSEDAYNTADLGTPLLPASVARDPSNAASGPGGLVIDRALRETNFNVTDAVLDSDTLWLRSRVRYELSDQLTFTNDLSRYHSDRHFINAEMYSYNAESSLIDRTTGIVTHDIDYWVERPALSGEVRVGGLRDRFTIGAEFSNLEFATRRYFGTATSVDPFAPVRGTFPGGAGAPLPPPNSRARVKVASVFGENALNLTPKWLLVAGARYDWIDFSRHIAPTTDFKREYGALSWRVGTVYDILPKTQVFAQYSRAIVPVGNFLLLSFANSQFDLTHGRSVEAGIKSSFWSDRIDVTLAAYHISQNDIVTRDPGDPRLSIQGGKQSSRGVELSLSAALTRQLRIDANWTRLDARFDELIDPGGVSRIGKTPPRIPETVANLFAFYSVEGLPLTLSAGLRHAGRFYTDNANAIRARGYTTVDAAIGYRFGFGELTLRGRNLTDAFYVDYTDMLPTQFQVGAPRSVEISLLTRF